MNGEPSDENILFRTPAVRTIFLLLSHIAPHAFKGPQKDPDIKLSVLMPVTNTAATPICFTVAVLQSNVNIFALTRSTLDE